MLLDNDDDDGDDRLSMDVSELHTGSG